MSAEATTTEKTIAEQAIEKAGPAAPAEEQPQAQPLNTSFADEDAALAEAERLEAEERARLEGKGEAAAPGEATPAGDAAAIAAAAAPATPADAKAGLAVAAKASEKAAVIALRRRLSEEHSARLIAEGQVKALEPLARARAGDAAADAEAAETEAPQASESELAIEALDREAEALADRFERGEMTAGEWKREDIALQKKQRSLIDQRHVEIAEAAARAVAEESGRTNDLGLEEHANILNRDYPILTKITAEQLARFEPLAYERARMEGVKIPATALGTKMLRERMAAIAEEFYDPARATQRKQEKAAAAGGAASTAQPAGAGAQPSKPTAQQREAKLTLASSLPPDIAKIGTGAQAGEMSEAAITAGLAGNEDAAIRFLEANPGLEARILGSKAAR